MARALLRMLRTGGETLWKEPMFRILLVDDANRRLLEGAPRVEAVILAARSRFVPIMMTSLATVIGLAPTALGLEAGTEANQALALAVVGGLTSSTILSLFLCPVMFLFFAKLTRRETLEESSQAPAVADLQGAQPSATA